MRGIIKDMQQLAKDLCSITVELFDKEENKKVSFGLYTEEQLETLKAENNGRYEILSITRD